MGANGGAVSSLGDLGLSVPLSNVGFDIAPGIASGTIYSLLSTTQAGDTSSKLYAIDPVGGATVLIGTMPSGVIFKDIAISPTDEISGDVLVQAPTYKKFKSVNRHGLPIEISCMEKPLRSQQFKISLLLTPAKKN